MVFNEEISHWSLQGVVSFQGLRMDVANLAVYKTWP